MNLNFQRGVCELRGCSLFVGRGGGGLANGETERLELFGPPQLRHVNIFDPPPPPNDAFVTKPYSHPPLSALLACLLLAPLAVEETITYVNHLMCRLK